MRVIPHTAFFICGAVTALATFFCRLEDAFRDPDLWPEDNALPATTVFFGLAAIVLPILMQMGSRGKNEG